MDEGILEVDEVAGDRVVELRGVGELHGVGLMTCEGEVIVQRRSRLRSRAGC